MQLVDALTRIRDVVTTTTTRTEVTTMTQDVPLECEWELPPPRPQMPFDKMLVNVELTAPGQAATQLGLVEDPADCAARGWHYDDFEEPTRIIACEETCSLIQSLSQANIGILLGCQTVPLL